MDILDLFEFDIPELKEFFICYIETRNELKSLKQCGSTFKDLTNWKNGSGNYNDIKNAIDDYFVNEVEAALYESAEKGNNKSMEFILTHRSNLYAKNKIEESVDLGDLIDQVLEGDDG